MSCGDSQTSCPGQIGESPDDEKIRLRTHNAELVKAFERLKNCIPNTWMDPLLSGPDRVIDTSYGLADIEKLLNALRDRISDELAKVIEGRNQ